MQTFTELFVVSLQLLVLGRQVDGILHGFQQHTPVSALRHPPLLLTDLTKHSEHLESKKTDTYLNIFIDCFLVYP